MKLADYLFILLGVGIGLLLQKQEPKAIAIEVTPDSEVADTLTEWQQLQLAIAITESRCNPSATGKTNDGGLLQIRPIYVSEVNRVSGTSYTHKDVYTPASAIDMFNRMQMYYNPEHDIDTAIRLHNKAPWYARKVKDNLEFVRRYEAVRSLL